MGLSAVNNEILKRLRAEIFNGHDTGKIPRSAGINTGFRPLEAAFPGNRFPTGAIHEFLSGNSQDAAATSGFISALLGRLMQAGGQTLWISTDRRLFPPGLVFFGLNPGDMVFVDVARQKEALWTVEEALKCASVSAVVGEFRDLDFNQSRRLQLAVERSRVTGFIHRLAPRSENTVACLTRWKISHLHSLTTDDLPGVGMPCWQVNLLKVRNGRPGSWQLEWTGQGFRPVPAIVSKDNEILKRKTG